MTRELRHIWDNRFQAISRIFPNREEIRVKFPHFKPSPEAPPRKGLAARFGDPLLACP